ncbi:TonB-dependent receptor [Phenylobacterium sp.]|jgi:outer membrane receptor protein involved in Fe transport|uniref:TonB-dependent receptor n=1 Tax=Phenylobacterium sp. TaxID=1871053 RepID=UPI002F929101
MRFRAAWPLAIAALAPAPLLAAEAEPPSVGELVVVGSPLSEGVPAERVPAQVRTLDPAVERPGTPGVSDALVERLGGVESVDSLGNPLQQTVSVRGFFASPALGEPQGVTVLQDAMRVNEAFGDVVQWDLVPAFAIARAQVVSGSNPVYGLNTTGGVVTLSMKDGFSAPERSVEVSAGSFGRRAAIAQAGFSAGDLGVYAGLDGLEEDGWRDASPSELARAYADVAWRPSAVAEVGLGLTAADSRLIGNGPAPEDLLAARRSAIFTYPDITDTRLLAAALRATFRPAAGLTIGGGAFVRDLERSTANGDRAEFEECDELGVEAPDDALCFGDHPEVLLDAAGDAVTEDEADAVFNHTRTRTRSGGVSGQLTWAADVGGRANVLVAGGAYETADTRYRSGSELGRLGADRGVESLGAALGNPEFNVGLETRSRSTGVYVSDTFSLTPELHLSGSLRWNRTELELRDQLGTALTGDHAFERLNAGLGVAWNVTDAFMTYLSAAQNSRAPTPAELSCADPETPCRFPNAFLADPPLEQVKARTLEAGGRGALGAMRWSASVFRTDLDDDIIFISAGPVMGTGYFDNVGGTRREGLEADLKGEAGPFAWSASYAYVRATYRTSFAIQAPDNPEAEADGDIEVGRGDRIPGIPLHSLKLNLDWQARPSLTVGADLRASSSRFLRGDEANLTDPLEGFAVLGVSARWRRGRIEAWARVENLLDAEYATFGLYGDADELGFESPRFVSPGTSRTLAIGLRARF